MAEGGARGEGKGGVGDRDTVEEGKGDSENEEAASKVTGHPLLLGIEPVE